MTNEVIPSFPGSARERTIDRLCLPSVGLRAALASSRARRSLASLGPQAEPGNQRESVARREPLTAEVPMNRPEKRKRRWLQFSLRTLLVAVAVLAVLLGLTTDRARRQRAAVRRTRELGGDIRYEYENQKGGQPPGPEWLRRLLGDEYFLTVIGIAFGTRYLTDDDLEYFKVLTDLRVLRLRNAQVTDAGLEKLKGFTKLTDLELSATQITDHGLVHLQGLLNLESLKLDDTDVTDQGLAHLKGMRSLEYLLLGKEQIIGEDLVPVSDITDAGLVHLEGIPSLQKLALYNTHVTEAGKQRLQQALPGLKIQESRTARRGAHGDRFDEEQQRWVPEE